MVDEVGDAAYPPLSIYFIWQGDNVSNEDGLIGSQTPTQSAFEPGVRLGHTSVRLRFNPCWRMYEKRYGHGSYQGAEVPW